MIGSNGVQMGMAHMYSDFVVECIYYAFLCYISRIVRKEIVQRPYIYSQTLANIFVCHDVSENGVFYGIPGYCKILLKFQ